MALKGESEREIDKTPTSIISVVMVCCQNANEMSRNNLHMMYCINIRVAWGLGLELLVPFCQVASKQFLRINLIF